MKKILLFASALAGLFLVGSCQKETLEPAAQGGVTYEITLPDGPQTKGEAGYGVYDLHYEVYKTADANALATTPLLFEKTVTMTGNTTTVTLDLLNDQDYTILFWANKQGENYFDLTDLRQVGVRQAASNNDDRDAFCGMDQLVQHDGAQSKTVELKRPFAQINIATLVPIAAEIGYDVTPTSSLVKVKNIPVKYNVFTGEPVGAAVEVEYTVNLIPKGNLTVNTTEYKKVAMNYALVPATQDNSATVEVYYEINTVNGTVKNSIPNVPVKKNYRTNIIGNLLTSNATYTIEVKPGFEGDNGAHVEVINEGIIKNINGDYEVSTAKGLAYAINNLWAGGGNFYLTAAEYDMTGLNVTAPTIPAGVTLNIYGETPVVTRAMTSIAGITIKGLDSIIDTIESGADVSISGVTVETTDENPEAKLVNEVEQGATVVVSECSVVDNAASETSDAMEDLIGTGSENVLNAAEVKTLAELQTALASGVTEIVVAGEIDITEDTVLDLNGKAINAVDTKESGNYALFEVQPGVTFTVNGTGLITLTAENDRDWNAYSSVISNQRGTLIVNEGVVIEHLGGTDMAYGIDNLTNGEGTKAITTVNGATVKSAYRAIRQFLNGTEATNELYVKAGSKVLGDNKAIWPQDANAHLNPGKLVVEAGAEINDVYLSAASPDKEWPLEISVPSSAFVEGGEIVLGTIPVGYEVVEVDGVWTIGKSYAAEGNKYTISTVKGLKDFAAMVNSAANVESYELVLAADLDLNNEQWVSIGTEKAPFTGVFDGQKHTIKNLSIVVSEGKQGKAYLGLFGYAKNATIKDVTLENVNLNIACLDIDHSQGHIGAVVGSLEGTSTIENVTVKGDIKVYATQDANGASRVAVVAGGNSYGNVTMKNVHVIADEGSYLIANNNTGALAGQLQGKSVFENCSSNIDVTVNKFFAGGIIGLAAGDQTFTNCHTTGDVAVVAGREGRNNDQYRVGGIAGGWADGAKNVCTLTGCTYTGKVSGKNSDGSVANPLDYAGYVGRGYTLNGCQGSKVVIDGVEYVQAYDDVFGIYKVDGGNPLVYNAETLTAAFAKGRDVVMAQDIYTEAATAAPYGNKYAFKLDGSVLDGNDHELYMECYGDHYGIMTSGGTIKNLTIKEGCRAVMIMYPQSDVILDNVNIGGDGVLYPINTGEAGAEGVNLIVTNSVLAGWTSYGLIESASFTNVEFKQGTYYNNIYGRVLKPYVNTTLTNCAFVEHMNLDLSSLTAGHKVTMNNCTVNGQAVTAGVFTIPTTDAQYDTELFTIDLPSWASSIDDCVVFN